MRAHTDHILSEYGAKTEEAATKISRVDLLQSDYDRTRHERDEALSAVQFLESRVQALQQTLETLEESRRCDQ